MDGGQLLKMITNNKLFKKSVANTIEKQVKELEQSKLLINHNPEWFTIKFTEKMPGVKGNSIDGIGVYKIMHKDDMITMYVGQGRISARRGCHKLVFKNKGKIIIGKTNSWTKSEAASKMYEYDTDIENWFFSFCVLHDKAVSQEYEKILIEDEEPLFNNLAMSGVN